MSAMSARFQTLLLREWMQHHRGWLLMMTVPPALFLLLLPFGEVHLPQNLPPIAVAAAAMAMTALVVFSLSFGMAMLQLPGLARRDQQDRSIEFWLSLPASHGESIGATVLAHALLAPLLALCVGAAFGPLMAAGVVAKGYGAAALGAVPWWALLLAGVAGLARGLVGVVLMVLWLAPLFMLLMAASAWLKRWGVPAVIGAVLIGGNVLSKVYDNPIVFELLQAQTDGATRALLHDRATLEVLEPQSVGGFVSGFAGWVAGDALGALGDLASLHLIGGLALAGACFFLLVLRRRGGQ